MTVVDRDNALQGMLPLDRLLVRDGNLRVNEVRESAQSCRRHVDRGRGARARQAGFVQAGFEPIVASIGGNTGNQTVALVIRGIALSQLNASNMLFLLRKELAIGIINGALWGVVMAFATLLLYHSVGLAAVMASAMVLNMLVASVIGVACPLVLERMGRDPVMGSSILLTAITDSMGFLIFLALASSLLL